MISRQLIGYITVGVIQVVLDTALLLLLVKFGAAAWLGNLLSRFLAAFAGYYLNKIWSFGDVESQAIRSFWRFWVWWLTASAIGSCVLYGLKAEDYPAELLGITKLMLELLLAGLTFIVFRYWVFRAAD